jgi:hypothetical protein
MPRGNIEDIGPAPDGFRVDLRTDDPTGLVKFEDADSCKNEDALRVASLERAIETKQLSGKDLKRAAKYIKFVKRVMAGKKRRVSAASRLQMLDWRIKVSGWLWWLIEPLGQHDWVFFTIILPSWWVRSADLKGVSSKQLMEKLRAALHRAGSAKASGWLYAMVHGEFDGDTAGFPLHVHGIATGDMVEVVRSLRKQRQFRRQDSDRARHPMLSVSRKVKIDKPWGHLPAVITYANKSYWPQHDSRIDDDGKRRRIGRKHRIDDPKHLVRHLLWLHFQHVKDHVLLVHLSVINGQLIAGKRGDRGSK